MRERVNEERIGELGEGTMLGKYRVVRPIGEGAMGAVYVGMHRDSGDRVAIKVLDRRLATMRQARERFRLEAEIAKRVRHPNIVEVIEAGDAGRHSYLVMELLTGEDLAQRLEGSGPIPAREVADILIPICAAIAAAHRAQVVHRDLKPLNIFLAAGNPLRPKVLDFGISVANDTPPPAAPGAGLVGSPCYLAPEQVADSAAAGPASDQYALGVIAYECLTGERPFDGEDLEVVLQAIALGEVRPPSALRPDLPPGLDAVVLRAMSRDPAARFASVADFGRALLPFASEAVRTAFASTLPAAEPTAQAPQPGAPAAADAPVPVPVSAVASGSISTGTSRRRTLSSPAIDIEAATRSPFTRTLPPEEPALAGVPEPVRAPPVLIGLPTTLYDDPGDVVLTPNVYRDSIAPALGRIGSAVAPILANRWARIGGGAAVAVVVVAALLTTHGSSDAPTPATAVPAAMPVAAPAPPPAPKPAPAVEPPLPAPAPTEAVVAAPAPPPAPPPAAAVPPAKPAPVAAVPAATAPPASAPRAPAPPREAPPPTEAAPAPASAEPKPSAAAKPIAAPAPRTNEARVGGRVEGRPEGRAEEEGDRGTPKTERRPARGAGSESKRLVPLLD